MPESISATPTPAPLTPRFSRESAAPVVAPVRCSVANAGRSIETRATRGSFASDARRLLAISATCESTSGSCGPATPPWPVIARASGVPRNVTITLDEPVI
jgi:hypothetical protein